MSALREAVEALLSNEEHATSGGMRSYAVGSPTWELWESVRQALALPDAEPIAWGEKLGLSSLASKELEWMPIWNRPKGHFPKCIEIVAFYTTPQPAIAPEPVNSLQAIADQLRRAGATLPVVPKGTIESVMQTGLSIALAIVENAIQEKQRSQP